MSVTTPQDLLRRIAAGETTFGLRDTKSAEAGAEFDALVATLFDLESKDYIRVLAKQKNFQSSTSEWYVATVALTPSGRELAHRSGR